MSFYCISNGFFWPKLNRIFLLTLLEEGFKNLKTKLLKNLEQKMMENLKPKIHQPPMKLFCQNGYSWKQLFRNVIRLTCAHKSGKLHVKKLNFTKVTAS